MIENPTDKDLRTLKMIVYLFTNKINKKQYVGKCVNKFIDRYVGCRWWEKPSNKYIKNSVEKYGLENFEISILEFNVENRDKLNELEKYYINKLNTLYPNGYNLLSGGDEMIHTKQTLDYIGERLAKDYIFYDHKLNKKIFVHNLSKFCRENNLSKTSMINVASGHYKRHKQYTLLETKIKKWEIISPNNETFIILEGELRRFCKKYNLNKYCIVKLCNGEFSQHLGWTCSKFTVDILKIVKAGH